MLRRLFVALVVASMLSVLTSAASLGDSSAASADDLGGVGASLSDDDESIVDIDLAVPPGGEEGLYLTHEDGRVEARGGLPHFGDRPVLLPGESVIALSSRPTVDGYWLFTTLGRAFPFGAAEWYGDAGNLALNAPMISAIAMPDGAGYYMVAEDGGIFTYGSAVFYGSVPQILPGVQLDGPVIGILPSPTGRGYHLVASDGGMFAFGDAVFRGSIPGVLPGVTLDSPVVGAIAQPEGYLMVADDGGMFTFGTAEFHGSLGGTGTRGIVAAAVKPDNSGYVMVDGLGKLSAFGDTSRLEPVYLPAGSDLQSIVDAHPAGTTFIVGAGTHRMQSIVPRDGDTFIGEPGAVMNGSQVLSGWTRVGTSSWKHTLAEPFPQGYLNGVCADDPGKSIATSVAAGLGCVFPEQLYELDPVTGATSLFERVPFVPDAALGRRQWMLEYASPTGSDARPLAVAVYVGDDVRQRLVELSTAPYAFGYDPADFGGAYVPDHERGECLPDSCPGNFELVYPSVAGGVVHLYRANDEPGDHPRWILGSVFAEGRTVDDVALIQSSYTGGNDYGNLEAVVRVGASLYHYYRRDTENVWRGGVQIANDAAGTPALIQSTFGSMGNFELVYPSVAGGVVHLYRANDEPGDHPRWILGSVFAEGRAVDDVALIQSSYTGGNDYGNLEAVVRVGASLYHYYRRDTENVWRGGVQIANDAAGTPSLIQSTFGSMGNLEVVYPSAAGGVVHIYRADDGAQMEWRSGSTFANGLGVVDEVTLVQSSYTSGANEGNFEVIVRDGNALHHFYRGDTTNNWQRGERIAQDASGGPSLVQSTFGTRGGLPDPYDGNDPYAAKASNVTIRGITIVKYANPAQTGAIGGFRPGLDWIIEGNEVAWNHGTGIKFRGAAEVSGNHTHHNGQYGLSCGDGNTTQDRGGELPEFGWFGGYCGNDAVVRGNTIEFNGLAEVGIEPGWGAGGSKFSQSQNLLVADNYVRANNGPGLWSDFSYGGTVYERNLVENNEHAGILVEITVGGTKVVENTVRNNGVQQEAISAKRGAACDPVKETCDEGDQAQIVVSNSPDVEVARNTVSVTDGYGHTISVLQRDHREVEGFYVGSFRVVVHDNTIEACGPGDGVYGLAGSGVPPSKFALPIDFYSNTYTVGDPSGSYWWWWDSRSLGFDEWRDQHPGERIQPRACNR